MPEERTHRVMLLIPPADPLRYPEEVRHLQLEYVTTADQRVNCDHCGDTALVQHHHLWAYMDFLQAHRRGEANKAPQFICFACEPEAVKKEVEETGNLPRYERTTGKNIHYDTRYL